MLTIVLIVAVLLVLIGLIVLRVRRGDHTAYADQDRDPFHAETARLAAAGLLYEHEGYASGRPRKSYSVTPAGEAVLRGRMKDPPGDPGLLRLYLGGIVGPEDVLTLARQERERHEARLVSYDRVLSLLPEGGDWEDAARTAELGRQFERFCAEFWREQADDPLAGGHP